MTWLTIMSCSSKIEKKDFHTHRTRQLVNNKRGIWTRYITSHAFYIYARMRLDSTQDKSDLLYWNYVGHFMPDNSSTLRSKLSCTWNTHKSKRYLVHIHLACCKINFWGHLMHRLSTCLPFSICRLPIFVNLSFNPLLFRFLLLDFLTRISTTIYTMDTNNKNKLSEVHSI